MKAKNIYQKLKKNVLVTLRNEDLQQTLVKMTAELKDAENMTEMMRFETKMLKDIIQAQTAAPTVAKVNLARRTRCCGGVRTLTLDSCPQIVECFCANRRRMPIACSETRAMHRVH